VGGGGKRKEENYDLDEIEWLLLYSVVSFFFLADTYIIIIYISSAELSISMFSAFHHG
jgi:hypothetical protein